MPLQRACGAESQVRNKLSNGPLRAQSNVRFTEYAATLQADVICRGYVGIPLSARQFCREPRWHRGRICTVLDGISVGDGFLRPHGAMQQKEAIKNE